MPVTAPIANIARGSLHDGPGVRTVIYFKGCPLRCRWCHNPETWSAHAQTICRPNKCIGCGQCIATCPEHHIMENDRIVFSRDGCSACGACAERCPANALAVIGEKKTTEDVWEKLQKDLHYYRASGGGVTFSGGECLLYPEFVARVAKRCQAEGIHTAVESALCIPWKNAETVLPFIDLFFADLKLVDPQKHQDYTGKDNHLILQNLQQLSTSAREVIVRIPLIPGVNDSPDDMRDFGTVLNGLGKKVSCVELLRYNDLASSKYEQLGLEYFSFGKETRSKETLAALVKELQRVVPHLPVICDA